MRLGLRWSRRKATGHGLAHHVARPLWFGRASAQNPGADLSRVPVGLDLRTVSLAEGIRAALASAVILVANHWIGSQVLVYAALAAQLTCFCDAGGSVRRRMPWLVAFSLLGAATWAGFGLLSSAPLWAILPSAGLFIFTSSFLRIWGLAAQGVGNVLTVVVALALDQPLSFAAAGMVAAAFTVGGLWAVFLTLAIWRIQPDAPARREISEAWRVLSYLVADIRDLAERPAARPSDWEGHARAHRRAMRDAIERARAVVADMIGARGPLSLRGAQNLLRLETADQMFGNLIALTDLLEHGASQSRRQAGARILRVLRPCLLAVSQAILTDRFDRPERIERAVRQMLAASAAAPELMSIVSALAERLRIVAVIATGDERDVFERPMAAEAAIPFRERALGPLIANLTWESAILRHAARAAVVSLPAIAFALVWVGPFQHWLTITVVLTMQPYFAATWQRALERIGGTAIGALIGAALAFVPQGSLATAGLLFPLSILGFAVRRVSYGAFIACLTPLVVVLVEVVVPGQSAWGTALLRLLYTLAGGVLAVGCCLVLWPSWEPGRLKRELRTTLLAYADWAGSALASLEEAPAEPAERARRSAGIAHNNLEAALSRALQEPHWQYEQGLEAVMVADATLRRFGASLLALRHERVPHPNAELWRDWLTAMLKSLAARGEPPAPPPEAAGSETLARLGRQLDLLAGALRRAWGEAAGGSRQ